MVNRFFNVSTNNVGSVLVKILMAEYANSPNVDADVIIVKVKHCNYMPTRDMIIKFEK